MNDRDRTDANDDFAASAKTLFDDSVDELDAATRSQLNRGRQAALAELESDRAAWVHWAPAAGVATAAVLAVVLWSGNRPAEVMVPDASASDFEILMDEDSLEMLEELEFYSWIELADAAPQADGQIG